MSRTGGGRQIGTWVPAGVMKHIDTGTTRTEMYRRRVPAMLVAFLYLVGLLFFGTIGFLLGRQTVVGSQTCWFGVGFAILYVAGIALVKRLLERRC